MSINRILVTEIRFDYSAELIAKMFWYQGIAKVSTIILTPDSLYQKADITIAAWCDTEAAYELIQRLRFQDDTIHNNWIVRDNSAVETSSFSSSFYEALYEDQPRWSDSWTDDDDDQATDKDDIRARVEELQVQADALEEGEIYENEEKPVIHVYPLCQKYTISEAKSALELLYRYLECGYCGMAPQQIAETIASVEAQLSLHGIETKTVREPIAPALQEKVEEERLIPNYRGGDYMTIPEAIARVELLSKHVLNPNYGNPMRPSFQEASDVFEYCEEIDFIDDFLHKNPQFELDLDKIFSATNSMTLYPIDSIAKLQQLEF